LTHYELIWIGVIGLEYNKILKKVLILIG